MVSWKSAFLLGSKDNCAAETFEGVISILFVSALLTFVSVYNGQSIAAISSQVGVYH